MKVLVISHNCFCTYENMGKTLMTLFSSFQSEEVCQLYCYNQYPDVMTACSYFRVTDLDILNSYYMLKNNACKVFPDMNKHDYSENINGFYLKSNNKSSMKVFLRDMMWRFSRWKNGSLLTWLKEENPTSIFLAPGRYKFIYNMAFYISRKLSIPIFSYICDDYYFTLKNSNVFSAIEIKLLKRKIEKLMKLSNHLFTINDDLSKVYMDAFNISTTTLFTETSNIIVDKPAKIQKPTHLSYLGNLNCKRYKSLISIGIALDNINSRYGTEYYLEIYSNERDEQILRELKAVNSIRFMGYISGDEYKRTFKKSEIFVHIEAFDDKSVNTVKYSMSTKIADILSSGKLLFAFGPKSVSSIRYLQRTGCAVVVTMEEELENKLSTVFLEHSKYTPVIQQAIKIANINHKKGSSSNILKYKLMTCI